MPPKLPQAASTSSLTLHLVLAVPTATLSLLMLALLLMLVKLPALLMCRERRSWWPTRLGEEVRVDTMLLCLVFDKPVVVMESEGLRRTLFFGTFGR
jgi:hypothetical protein